MNIHEYMMKLESMGPQFTGMLEDLKQKLEIAKMTGSYILTNIESNKKELILQAAMETAFNIYIQEDAYPDPKYIPNGKKMEGYIAVYTRDIYLDHGPFWKRYDELVGEDDE